ncbi:MAG: hypothetical protein GKR98_11865 [Boseongicola sp.]|nr:MAG: hypothetical protein GKR98_11865 [Boseongicola sp.]
MERFDLDKLVNDLRGAATGANANGAIKDILKKTVSEPEQLSKMMPDFEENDVILFEDETISIWHCRFMPGHTVPAHDHQMLATIGVYRGAERNEFYETDDTGAMHKVSEVQLTAGNVLQIGPDAIHAVGCDSPEPCCGIHVYLGELTTVDRSIFDIKSGEELKFTDDNYNKLTSRDID